MASKPGILTNWPWTCLGSYKHILLTPWAVHIVHILMTKEREEIDMGYVLIYPLLYIRMLHNQIWISYSRYRNSKGNNRIIDKGIDYDQVDRESNWDDQIILSGLLFYIGHMTLPNTAHLPLWNAKGAIFTILLHIGPVEFLYYWLHRALHHHYLYSRYHSHHHSSIMTEPITSVIHPFAEHIAYFLLFSIPLFATLFTQTASIITFGVYVYFIDLMNNLGHCNFEFIPSWLFRVFSPLKYLMYTPSYHSLHHTQFRTNYALFMPFYDYIYNTMDKSSDMVYEKALKRKEDSPEVVHLTHLTTPESIYHLSFGLASFASNPYSSKWYLWAMWPLTCWSFMRNSIKGNAFVADRTLFDKLKMQSWVIPRYNLHYFLQRRREAINELIDKAIVEADKRGVKVISLGLLNQGEELNENGQLYVEKHPELKIKVVDGTSLAVAVVINSVPKGITQLVFRGKLTKAAYAIVSHLCDKGIQVATLQQDEYENLKLRLPDKTKDNLFLWTSDACPQKIWLIGDDITEKDQSKAPKGTLFIPVSQFPPKKIRKDCYYHTTPAMLSPSSMENMYSCENWLPRKAMSAWRVAGILHGLEGWNMHECGDIIMNIDEIWEASSRHGFRPFVLPTSAI